MVQGKRLSPETGAGLEGRSVSADGAATNQEILNISFAEQIVNEPTIHNRGTCDSTSNNPAAGDTTIDHLKG